MSKTTSRVSTIDDATPEAVAVEAPAAVDATEVVGRNFDDELSGKKRTITIYAQEGDGGSDAVFVSLNGYAYQIPRDKPSSVPDEVVEILRNARTTLMVQKPGGAIEQREVPRYTFSID